MLIQRNVPELHAALADLAREHQWLPGPTVDGHPTRWMPCDAEGCHTVSAHRSYTVTGGFYVSVICEDCAAPCPDVVCGLLVYEHRDGCEPRD